MYHRIPSKAKQAPIILLLTALALAGMSVPAWAAGIPFAGTISDLLTKATGWLSGIIATAGGLMFGYHAVMRNFIDDPQSVAHHTASMRKVAIGTALGAGASGLTSWISSMFSGGGGGGGTTATGMLMVHHATMLAMVASKHFGV